MPFYFWGHLLNIPIYTLKSHKITFILSHPVCRKNEGNFMKDFDKKDANLRLSQTAMSDSENTSAHPSLRQF